MKQIALFLTLIAVLILFSCNTEKKEKDTFYKNINESFIKNKTHIHQLISLLQTLDTSSPKVYEINEVVPKNTMSHYLEITFSNKSNIPICENLPYPFQNDSSVLVLTVFENNYTDNSVAYAGAGDKGYKNPAAFYLKYGISPKLISSLSYFDKNKLDTNIIKSVLANKISEECLNDVYTDWKLYQNNYFVSHTQELANIKYLLFVHASKIIKPVYYTRSVDPALKAIQDAVDKSSNRQTSNFQYTGGMVESEVKLFDLYKHSLVCSYTMYTGNSNSFNQVSDEEVSNILMKDLNENIMIELNKKLFYTK